MSMGFNFSIHIRPHDLIGLSHFLTFFGKKKNKKKNIPSWLCNKTIIPSSSSSFAVNVSCNKCWWCWWLQVSIFFRSHSKIIWQICGWVSLSRPQMKMKQRPSKKKKEKKRRFHFRFPLRHSHTHYVMAYEWMLLNLGGAMWYSLYACMCPARCAIFKKRERMCLRRHAQFSSLRLPQPSSPFHLRFSFNEQSHTQPSLSLGREWLMHAKKQSKCVWVQWEGRKGWASLSSHTLTLPLPWLLIIRPKICTCSSARRRRSAMTLLEWEYFQSSCLRWRRWEK